MLTNETNFILIWSKKKPLTIQKALSLSVLQILAISCELRFSYICNVICLLAIQPFPLISSINVENRGVWGLWSNSEIPDSCHLPRSLRLEAVIPPQATKSWLLPDRDRPPALAMAGCPHCPQGDSGVTVTEVSPRRSSPSHPYVRTGYTTFTGPRPAIPQSSKGGFLSSLQHQGNSTYFS